MEDLLVLEDVNVSYGADQVLRDVSFHVKQGRICGVVGESGSGKSTIIYAILGILEGGRVTSGSITYNGADLATLSREEMRETRGGQIALIAQEPAESFHPTRTLRRQLYEVADCHRDVSRAEAERRMISYLETFGIDAPQRVLDGYSFELSGGMCQRASIAMAMALSPSLILADEPTSALDVVTQKQVVAQLADLRDESGVSVLFVSHNIGVVAGLADDVLVMYAGCIVERGLAALVMNAPLHPYTRNLVAAVPRMDRPLARAIKVPPADRSLSGCPYRLGCRAACDACADAFPMLTEAAPGHFVRCPRVAQVAEVYEKEGDAL